MKKHEISMWDAYKRKKAKYLLVRRLKLVAKILCAIVLIVALDFVMKIANVPNEVSEPTEYAVGISVGFWLVNDFV